MHIETNLKEDIVCCHNLIPTFMTWDFTNVPSMLVTNMQIFC